MNWTEFEIVRDFEFTFVWKGMLNRWMIFWRVLDLRIILLGGGTDGRLFVGWGMRHIRFGFVGLNLCVSTLGMVSRRH